MTETRSGSRADEARRVVTRMVRLLADKDPAAAVALCRPDARWWLPLDGAADLGAADACARLAALLDAAAAIEPQAVIVAPDGRSAVVEVGATPRGAAQRTTLTAVLRLDRGLVADGRVYLDVAAWPGGVR